MMFRVAINISEMIEGSFTHIFYFEKACKEKKELKEILDIFYEEAKEFIEENGK